mmetsp:Transcript_21766/g.45614  ORF Transcript_21766/g.45614 Transcript_21766/m.45614 type:complete len:253 (+) Transcript_21766:2851-3609(+)
MWVVNDVLTSLEQSISKSLMKPWLTLTRASSGHAKNQSMVGLLTKPGNLRARIGNFGFIGDMQRMMCKLSRTQSVKYCFKLSGVSSLPGRSRKKSRRMSAVIAIISSFANKPGTSPVERIELIVSRNTSSFISLSVKRNVVGWRLWPAFLYKMRMSSIRALLLYCLVRVIWKHMALEMYEANRVKLCFPLPPTPTSSPLPRGISINLLILSMCFNASSNKTSSIRFDGYSSLYLSKNIHARSRIISNVPPSS